MTVALGPMIDLIQASSYGHPAPLPFLEGSYSPVLQWAYRIPGLNFRNKLARDYWGLTYSPK